MRSRRDFLLTRKSPRRDLSQMSTKPRNLKVSGLERPRLLRNRSHPLPLILSVAAGLAFV